MGDLSEFNDRRLNEFDQEISELRTEFDKLSNDERLAFRGWLERLVQVVAEQPSSPPISVLCRTDVLDCNDEGDIIYDGLVHLGPATMLSAVKAWDVGDEVRPTSFLQT